MQNLRKYAVFTALVIAVCIAFGAVAGYNNTKNKTSPFSVTASADENASVVYMTTAITPESLMKIYDR